MTYPAFEADDYPGRPRILFVGYAGSPHTQSWITLLRGAAFNVRLYSPYMEDTPPPGSFLVRTYLSIPNWTLDNEYRRAVLPPPPPLPPRVPPPPAPRLREVVRQAIHEKLFGSPNAEQGPPPPPAPSPPPLPERIDNYLASVVENWRPHIVHTLGLFNAGLYFHELARRFGIINRTHWVLQLRGGSDLEVNRFVPEARARIVAAARDADQILSDNQRNFAYLRELGVDPGRFSQIGTVPGSGGLDLTALGKWETPTTSRRAILWPKAYHTQFATALPVVEGLRLAWPRLPRCRLILLWTVQNDIREWLMTLPEEMRASCEILGRVPREEVIVKASEARVVLTPSLVDGIPNIMYEAMACGAVPIVSPLDTIADVVREPDNVLFARNLYPDEIADALVRAMTDDHLAARIVSNNLAVVRRLADRAAIRSRVIELYEALAMGSGGGS